MYGDLYFVQEPAKSTWVAGMQRPCMNESDTVDTCEVCIKGSYGLGP